MVLGELHLTDFMLSFLCAVGFWSVIPFSDALPRLLVASLTAFVSSHRDGGSVPQILTCIESFTSFACGIAAALPVVLVVSFSQTFGELLDTGRGQNFMQSYDATGQPATPLGALIEKQTLFLFLVSGLLYAPLVCLLDIQQRPQLEASAILTVLEASSRSVIATALPYLALFFSLEFGFGFVQKASGNMLSANEAFTAKTITLLVLFLLHGVPARELLGG